MHMKPSELGPPSSHSPSLGHKQRLLHSHTCSTPSASRVGTFVGLFVVGDLLGLGVGTRVGSLVVGSLVGFLVGIRVGDLLGLAVGVAVGFLDGGDGWKTVGSAVGSWVGSAVGSCVGEAEGTCVGRKVGSGVGREVGGEVSTLCCSSSEPPEIIGMVGFEVEICPALVGK